MIRPATLHALVGILHTEAEYCEVAAQHAVESHNREYAQAKLDRATLCRGYAAEINAHLITLPPATPGDGAATT